MSGSSLAQRERSDWLLQYPHPRKQLAVAHALGPSRGALDRRNALSVCQCLDFSKAGAPVGPHAEALLEERLEESQKPSDRGLLARSFRIVVDATLRAIGVDPKRSLLGVHDLRQGGDRLAGEPRLHSQPSSGKRPAFPTDTQESIETLLWIAIYPGLGLHRCRYSHSHIPN